MRWAMHRRRGIWCHFDHASAVPVSFRTGVKVGQSPEQTRNPAPPSRSYITGLMERTGGPLGDRDDLLSIDPPLRRRAVTGRLRGSSTSRRAPITLIGIAPHRARYSAAALSDDDRMRRASTFPREGFIPERHGCTPAASQQVRCR